jgi:CubicO group peptidase (beta-lactamase class C family)
MISRWIAILMLVPAASVACSSGRDAAPGGVRCTERYLSAGYRSAAARVRPLVPKLWRGLRAPGMAFAVAVKGRLVWSMTCGLRNRSAQLPVERTTRFRIGSVSKTLTSAALASLVQSRQMALDDSVRVYVAAFPHDATIRELASHTAGLRANAADELVNGRHYRSVTDALAIFIDDPLLFAPGTDYAYSNWGYVLLGAAIEKAARAPYARVVRDRVLAPLGLRRTVLDDVTHPVAAATPYEIRDDGSAVRAPYTDLSFRWPSGGWLSTAEDVARFGSGFADGKLVPRSLVRTFTTEVRVRGHGTGYGLGWEVRGPYAGHTGNAVGGSAALLVHLPSATAFALTTNLGFVTAPSPPQPRRGTPTPPELLTPFLRRK